MKKNKLLAQNKQYYLKLYLQNRGYTLKDLKCEIILMLSEMLIDEFIKAEDEGKNEIIIDNFPQNEKKYIYNNLKNLQIDLKKNILTVNKMQMIINSKNLNQESLIRARITESIYYFYNLCAITLKSSLLKINNDNSEKIKWIPDLIAIFLIIDMKERNYYFNYFSFLEHYDFDKIINIYTHTNILIKKKDNMSFLNKEQTILSKMMNVSIEIVEKLINSKYK